MISWNVASVGYSLTKFSTSSTLIRLESAETGAEGKAKREPEAKPKLEIAPKAEAKPTVIIEVHDLRKEKKNEMKFLEWKYFKEKN